MLRDTAVDLVMGRLGNRKDTALRNTIISEMVQAQEQVLEKTYPLPWFLITEDTTLATVVDTKAVALPTAYINMWDDGGLARVTSDGEELKLVREDFDIIRLRYPGSDTPSYYDIVGNNIQMRPIPNAVVSLVLWYYAKAPTLAGTYGDANNIENVWLAEASAWLMAEASIKVAIHHLQSPKMAQPFADEAKIARNALLVQITAREEAQKQRFMEG